MSASPIQRKLENIVLDEKPIFNLKFEQQIDQCFLWIEKWRDEEVSFYFGVIFLKNKIQKPVSKGHSN